MLIPVTKESTNQILKELEKETLNHFDMYIDSDGVLWARANHFDELFKAETIEQVIKIQSNFLSPETVRKQQKLITKFKEIADIIEAGGTITNVDVKYSVQPNELYFNYSSTGTTTDSKDLSEVIKDLEVALSDKKGTDFKFETLYSKRNKKSYKSATVDDIIEALNEII